MTFTKRRTKNLLVTLSELDIVPCKFLRAQEMAMDLSLGSIEVTRFERVAFISAGMCAFGVALSVIAVCFGASAAWVVWAFVLAALGAVIYLTSANQDTALPPKVTWTMVDLEKYKSCKEYPALSEQVLLAVSAIRERCAQTEFTISILKIGNRQVEKFLYVKCGKESYLISKWG